jgi:beta-N-acetylhexosaminidase
MSDVSGVQLTDEDRQFLQNPALGGVILFARNFTSAAQVKALCAEIKAIRSPELLIAVDQEGGRVQRFKDVPEFTRLPAMRVLGDLWDSNVPEARARAFELGQALAEELAAVGVDFSFTPVLDLDWGASGVIGDRAFHHNPYVTAALATALMQGLRSTGMGAVGKHFPGHGFIKADTHHEVATDEREFSEIEQADLVPFAELINAGLPAIMPAHVIYPKVDQQAACYSPHWLKTVLRQQLHFQGMIFSDDLGMVGSHTAGNIVDRAQAALTAGCDMVLSCNDRPESLKLIAGLTLDPAQQTTLALRAEAMRLAH